MHEARLERLRAILAQVDDLQRAAAVLEWDRQTYMPPAGSAARAEQMATLQALAHERFTAPEVGELLAELAPWASAQPYDAFAASLVRVTAREYALATKVPAAFVAAYARAAAAGFDAWLQARRARDFRPFAAPFVRLVELSRQAADYLGPAPSRYDALLQRIEPGTTSAQLEALFARLKAVLVPLARAVAERADRVSDAVIRQGFDPARQWDLTVQAVTAIGFDLERGRQDRSVHPFTIAFSWGDVRLTTRIDPERFTDALYSSLHEAGHGLYEQGVPQELWRSPLGGGASAGLHESQSRLWENVVGRSRAFWEFFLPRARDAFPSQLGSADVEEVYRAVNRSAPSLIRTEADEVTYNLHIIVRYELEQALLAGDLDPADTPAAWNDKMRQYLGVTPPSDLEGCLQDIHWTGGIQASFPGYALGNVIALQLYERAVADRPEIPDGIRRGDFAPLLGWLREHVHRHGAKLTPAEVLQRETGRGLDPEPYLRYLQAKYGELYGLT